MSDDNKDVKDEKRRHKRAAKKPAAGFKNGQKTPSTRSRNTSKKRYHISCDGTARPCSAQSEATCRLARSGTPHFDSPEQGEAYIAERRNDGVGRPVSGVGTAISPHGKTPIIRTTPLTLTVTGITGIPPVMKLSMRFGKR